MRCKTKQREDSRSDLPRKLSGLILGYRRITANENSLGVPPLVRVAG